MDCFVALLLAMTENGKRPSCRSSSAGRAADVDHVAVTGCGILVDETGDQHAAVERNDLAVLLGGGRSGRTDIILAVRGALEAQLLRRRLVSQMHDHAARRSGSDHVRLLALRPRRGFGARTVSRILERGEAPAADDLIGPDRPPHFPPNPWPPTPPRAGPPKRWQAHAATRAQEDRQRRGDPQIGNPAHAT